MFNVWSNIPTKNIFNECRRHNYIRNINNISPDLSEIFNQLHSVTTTVTVKSVKSNHFDPVGSVLLCDLQRVDEFLVKNIILC